MAGWRWKEGMQGVRTRDDTRGQPLCHGSGGGLFLRIVFALCGMQSVHHDGSCHRSKPPRQVAISTDQSEITPRIPHNHSSRTECTVCGDVNWIHTHMTLAKPPSPTRTLLVAHGTSLYAHSDRFPTPPHVFKGHRHASYSAYCLTYSAASLA